MSKKKNWIYGRNVVLTGCSTGMGKEIALILAQKYACNIVGIARNEAKLQEMKRLLGDRFSYRRFDISSQQAWLEFADEMEQIGFHTDLLINNAGMIQPFLPYSGLTAQQIQTVLHTNLVSVVSACHAMIPAIKRSPFGGIVNVASASAILPVGGESIYSATKAGVWGLSACLDQELRGFGKFCSCVMPGPVKTDIYKARESEGEVGNKADNLVQNVGITAKTAAKRIVNKAIRKRKMFVKTDFIAKLMDFGMRVMPVSTMRITSKLMKSASGMVSSFYPIYAEQIEQKAQIRKMLKERKKSIYKAKTVPAQGFFAEQEHAEGQAKDTQDEQK